MTSSLLRLARLACRFAIKLSAVDENRIAAAEGHLPDFAQHWELVQSSSAASPPSTASDDACCTTASKHVKHSVDMGGRRKSQDDVAQLTAEADELRSPLY
jgi:hypothetical protein